jgi:ABC-2 type transport system ATP-binding protein
VAPEEDDVIHAEGLARTFRTRTGPVEAVRGVDLDVREGEIVGFLGPNGAGKTTTLRMLTTLLVPTAGVATVAGATCGPTRSESVAGSGTSPRAG